MTSPASSRSDPARGTADVRFEAVARRHADALTLLFERNAVPAVSDGFDPFPLSAEKAREIACDPRRDAYFVAFEDERAVAMSMLRGADEGYETPSFGIFVDREAQGAGLGRELTRHTIDAAREAGAPAVRLSVYAENLRARRLYESLGFAESQREPAGGREKLVMVLDLRSNRG